MKCTYSFNQAIVVIDLIRFEVEMAGINNIESCSKDVSSDHNEVFQDFEQSVAANIILNNYSFSSSNTSVYGKSCVRSDTSSLDGNLNLDDGNPDLRGLFCHILTKLEVLEDQLNIEKERFKSMKNEYDNKLKNLKKLNNSLTSEVDEIYDEM